MTTIQLALLAIGAYLGNALLIARHFHKHRNEKAPLSPAWLAVAAHFGYIGLNFAEHQGFNFSFFSTASLVSMIVALLLLTEAINKPVEKLGVILFPITALMLGLDAVFSEKPHPLQIHNWQMSTHILTSIIAFSLLNIAALQAILLAVQDQQLRSHPPKHFVQSLPPLQTMESLLFQMLSAGLFFLTISLVSGFIFVDDLFAQHLVHKTVLSILAWINFSGLILGRIRYGWRGRTAIKLTLCGFLSLLLAYFGSKLVLELILHR